MLLATQVGRYRFDRLLADGGMSSVYLAHHLLLDKPVAIKVLAMDSVDASLCAQFMREATLTASLEHPNIARVTDFFAEDGRFYLVMEYIEGTTLEALVEKKGPLPESEVVALAHQLMDALHYLHRRTPAVVMQDLKPSNIMLTPEGTCKLIDFGIARRTTGSSPELKGYGTPGFAPPEQYRGLTDTRSDLYALGATLFFLLSGQEPPEAMARLAQPHTTLLKPRTSPLWTLVHALMSLRPEDRPQTASQARVALGPPAPEATTLEMPTQPTDDGHAEAWAGWLLFWGIFGLPASLGLLALMAVLQ